MGTLTDDSGGSSLRLCEECRKFAFAPRCGFCGDLKTGRHKAGVLYFLDDTDESENEQTVEVCDSCRHDLLFGREVAI
jgi:predicted RNA-binding Zn-ribbon protein involved in translation (DUF1610 family)